MKSDYLDFVRQVLDRQVVDANNIPCGKVDDLELEGGFTTPLKVKSLLIGFGAASERLPALAQVVLRKVFGKPIVKVSWDRVSVITNHVKLNVRADELGLAESTTRAFRIISALPGSWKK